jgi:hypothetical protein
MEKPGLKEKKGKGGEYKRGRRTKPKRKSLFLW